MKRDEFPPHFGLIFLGPPFGDTKMGSVPPPYFGIFGISQASRQGIRPNQLSLMAYGICQLVANGFGVCARRVPANRVSRGQLTKIYMVKLADTTKNVVYWVPTPYGGA